MFAQELLLLFSMREKANLSLELTNLTMCLEERKEKQKQKKKRNAFETLFSKSRLHLLFYS